MGTHPSARRIPQVRPCRALALLLVPMALAAAPATADTILVFPGDSIQAAIQRPATTHGDVILVAPGIYAESIDYLGKSVTVRSTDGPQLTIIDGSGGFDSVVKWVTGEGPGAVLDGFTVTGGYTSSGGGLFTFQASPTIRRCIITANGTMYEGAGMYAYGGSPIITECTFADNNAAFEGGAMFLFSANPVVTNCTFTGNTGYYGGAVENWELSSPQFVNCIFTDNGAQEDGGAMENYGGSNPLIVNNTFTGNSARRGGAIANLNSSPTIMNSILWGNTASIYGSEISNAGNGMPVIGYSDVAGSGGSNGWNAILGDNQGGNIDADPRFVNDGGLDSLALVGDFRLRPDSPCVDAADNNAVPADRANIDGDVDLDERVPLDLDRNARFVNEPTAADTGVADPPEYAGIADMGAYETQHEGCPADVNGDGVVDRCDFMRLLDAWGGSDVPEDLNGDGIVDADDFLQMLNAWGPCPVAHGQKLATQRPPKRPKRRRRTMHTNQDRF